ncbi:hypothetical protein EDC04DRAFT_911320 [Pisolithus marmoratus]|nr:hypothetical protein EDC04DRAFT_911320 [Pisolithus marmoratus]
MWFVYFLSVIFVLPVLISGAPVGFGRVVPVYVFDDKVQSPVDRIMAGDSVVQTSKVLAINVGDPTGSWLESVVKSVKPFRYLTNSHAEVTVYVQQPASSAD